ncbi:MAG TPA: hypothetical protein VNA28_01780 [Solirubrobacteraceae bacterium]|nr:hypothetical protein [Solirubrobacteraceae bacterium]
MLPGAAAQAARGEQPASRARDRSVAPPPRTATADSLTTIAQQSPEITVPEKADPVTPGPHVPERPEPDPLPPGVAEPARPLETVAETVAETTTALATILRHAAAVFAHGLTAISPAAAPAVTDAGAAPAETVDEAGRAVRGILGGRPGD